MDKVICIGKNYLDHAKEMSKFGDGYIPEKPVIFFKPPSTLKQASETGSTLKVAHPLEHGEAHHECEIVLRVNKDCYKITPKDALNCFDAVTLGLDMTLRDLQAQQKKNGQPWEIAKSFKNSALIGPWIYLEGFKNYLTEEFSFSLNGNVKQTGLGSKMRMNPYECLAYVSEYFEIKKGDILFTGTPEGVGPVKSGDKGQLSWGKHMDVRVQW